MSVEADSTPPSTRGSKIDRFTPLYSLMFLLVFSAEILFDSDYRGVVSFDGILLLVAAVAYLLAMFANVIRRRWRRFLSLILSPVFALALLAGCAKIGISPDIIRFAALSWQYEGLVGVEKYKKFYWKDAGVFLGGGIFIELVFDESDGIWSRCWASKGVAGQVGGFSRCEVLGERPDEINEVQALWNHFYFNRIYY